MRKVGLTPEGGFPRYGYHREMPFGMKWQCPMPAVRCYPGRLPHDMAVAGWELLEVDPLTGPDPFVLYDAWGCIVAEWETEPSYGSLLEFLPLVRRKKS